MKYQELARPAIQQEPLFRARCLSLHLKGLEDPLIDRVWRQLREVCVHASLSFKC